MYRRGIYKQDKIKPYHPDRTDRIILNVGDSFKFCYRFFDMEEVPNNLSLSNLNIYIKYFIKGSSKFYPVRKYRLDLLNCIIVDDQKLLKAIIEKPNLGCGDLFAEFNLYWFDFEFATTRSISQYVVDTKVTIVSPTNINELNLIQSNESNSIGFDENTGDIY